LTVIAPLVPELTPFQRLLITCPLASVRRTVQPASAALLVLRTVTSAWKPPGHWLTTV